MRNLVQQVVNQAKVHNRITTSIIVVALVALVAGVYGTYRQKQ